MGEILFLSYVTPFSKGNYYGQMRSQESTAWIPLWEIL